LRRVAGPLSTLEAMLEPTPPSPIVPWTVGVARRIRTLWMVKALATTLGISGFFFLYFWVMRSGDGHAWVVPPVVIDGWIGVSQLAVLPYASLWVYVSLAPALAADMASLRRYVAGALVISVVGLATYWFFPTMVQTPVVDWSDYPALAFLKARDAGGNAFPSLHVAFAAYSGVVLARELRSVHAPAWVRWANWLWCAAIVYSTLATRQHVVLDVVGGLLLAGVAVQICEHRWSGSATVRSKG
jgi:membrane-associated phospholipid phosphatase